MNFMKLLYVKLPNVIIEFANAKLEKLSKEGRNYKDSKGAIPLDICTRFKKQIDVLKSITTLSQLYTLRSLKYEKLKGTDYESIRINDQYRIHLRMTTEVEDPNKIVQCSVLAISNHYDIIEW